MPYGLLNVLGVLEEIVSVIYIYIVIKETGFSETSVYFVQTTWRLI
jgi:hypothetical protein